LVAGGVGATGARDTTAVSVGTSTAKLLDRSERRTSVIFAHTHATAIVYIRQKSGATTTRDFPLFPRSYLIWNRKIGDDPRTEFHAISDTAATSVRVLEQVNPELL
jgi:hypothetical protein